MLRILLALCLISFSAPTFAQEPANDDASIERRFELADQMLAINPPRDQVRSAIDGYVDTYMGEVSLGDKERFRAAMMQVINHRTLETLSREAYVELFTIAELEAMVEYYSKPEAISAREKVPAFNARIYPEITRMIDQAIMKATTTE